MIGFSTKTREVKVYHFDTMTKEYVGNEVVVVPPHTGLPADCCLVAPPVAKDGFIQVWNGKAWGYEQDLRGIMIYHKQTGSEMVLRELGPIPDDYVSDKPAGAFVKWENGVWVENTAAKNTALIEHANQRKNAELAHAHELIKPLEFADKLEMATELEKKNLKALMTHVVLLSRINTDDAEKIEWPELTLAL